MLKLVLGASGSGKTTLLYARIRARAEAGKRSILLVPEQFTSSTEARIYRELGDALSWCAVRWRNCRITCTTTTATGAVQLFARWRQRPSTS